MRGTGPDVNSDESTRILSLGAWTYEDRRAAGREGWDLFECPDSDDGPLQLQALADGPDDWPEEQDTPFGETARDDLAWLHVVARAREGSWLHAKALIVLAAENPDEFARVTRFAAEHGQN